MIYHYSGLPPYEADRVWVARNQWDGTFDEVVRFGGAKTMTVERAKKVVEDYFDGAKAPTSSKLTHLILTLTNVALTPEAYEVIETVQSSQTGSTPDRITTIEEGQDVVGAAFGLAVRLPAGMAVTPGVLGGEIHFFPFVTIAANDRWEYNGTNYVAPQLTLHAVGDPTLVNGSGSPLFRRRLICETLPADITEFPVTAASLSA